jgi:hypothetical protein
LRSEDVAGGIANKRLANKFARIIDLRGQSLAERLSTIDNKVYFSVSRRFFSLLLISYYDQQCGATVANGRFLFLVCNQRVRKKLSDFGA